MKGISGKTRENSGIEDQGGTIRDESDHEQDHGKRPTGRRFQIQEESAE